MRRKPRRPNLRGHRRRMVRSWPFCFYCWTKLDFDTATIDHLLPVSMGGRDIRENFVLACEPCNRAKGNLLDHRLIDLYIYRKLVADDYYPEDLYANHQTQQTDE